MGGEENKIEPNCLPMRPSFVTIIPAEKGWGDERGRTGWVITTPRNDCCGISDPRRPGLHLAARQETGRAGLRFHQEGRSGTGFLRSRDGKND